VLYFQSIKSQERTHQNVAEINSANINSPEYHYKKGEELFERGYIRSALEAFDKAIQVNPNYCRAYNKKGLLYAIQRKFDRAIESYEKALSINPLYEEAALNLGNCYLY